MTVAQNKKGFNGIFWLTANHFVNKIWVL